MKTFEDLEKIKETKKRSNSLLFIIRLLALPFVFCMNLTWMIINLFMNMRLFMVYGGILEIYEKNDLKTFTKELKSINEKIDLIQDNIDNKH